MIPFEELKNRAFAFQEILRENKIDGALIVQRADVIYFSGTAQNVHIYIPREGRPIVLAYRDIARAMEESPWGVIPLTGISKIPNLILGAGLPEPKVIGLEFDVLPVAQYERYRKAFSGAEFVDVSYDIRLLRSVKSEWEIQRIEESGKIYSALVDYAPTILRPGMTEVEFEALLEAKARILGHEPMIRLRGFGSEFHFSGVVAGERSAVPGYFDGPIVGLGASFTHPLGPSYAQIQPAEPIIMDLAVMRHGYLIDTTRVLVLGELSKEFNLVYETALAVEEKIRKSLVPGRVAGEVYDEVLAWVKKETPYSENFMGYGPSQVRFVGHGIGLELDELPIISKGAKEILQAGMTISIEPKFVFSGKGAIGVEDTLVVEGAEGARYLCDTSRRIYRFTN